MALKAKGAPDLGRFDWQDPFRMEDQLTEEERMLRDAARAYAQEKLQPRVIAAYREEFTVFYRHRVCPWFFTIDGVELSIYQDQGCETVHWESSCHCAEVRVSHE